MKKTRILFVALVVALVLVAVPLLSAQAQDKMPAPIDPQSWQQNKDRTWDDFVPNPVINWITDLNPEGYMNSKAIQEQGSPFNRPAADIQTPIRGAIILVDFIDKPFITSQPLGSDLFGFNLFKTEGGGLQPFVTNNPVRNHPDRDTLAEWWCDYLNKKLIENNGSAFNEFSLENTYGKWGVDLTGFGPYTLNGLELQYGGLGNNDKPPSLRISGSILNEGTAAALAGADGKAPWNPDEFDFFFIIHSGYDESGVWLPFGMMQWSAITLADAKKVVPDLYGPKTKLTELENLFTAHPEHVTRLATKSGSTAFIRDEAAKIAAMTTAGTLSQYQFRFPQSEWDWATATGNAASTRYVAWTAWAARISYWSGASGWSYTSRKYNNASRNLRYSIQGENDGMATFAHEYGHISGIGDNYDNPYTYRLSPKTEPWELMSRGSFAGPFGDQARWTVPGIEGGSVPTNFMAFNKTASSSYDPGDVLTITNTQLAASTPVVANIVARNVPLNNRVVNGKKVYQWLEDEYGLVSPNYYKALQLNFGSGVWADQAGTTANRKTTGFSWNSATATRVFLEVVQRTGYDSFTPDDGVIIARNNYVVDSHLYDIAMIDYVMKDGFGPGKDDFASHTLGSMGQVYDAAFHAGKSFVDTGYYASIYDPADSHYNSEEARYYAGEGNFSWQKAMIKPGSQVQWEPRDGRPIVSGDTVNEWRDPYNKLHFYILEKHMNPGKYGEFLSYTVGVLHEDGTAVGGALDVKLADIEVETPGRVAVATFAVTNTGNATDIVRVGIDGGALNTVLLNDLYAIGAGETINVPVYVEVPKGVPGNKKVDITVSSESNAGKKGFATAKLEDLMIHNFYVYMDSSYDLYEPGETISVDVMLKGDKNYTQFNAAITFDASLLEYAGYANLSGLAAEVKAAGSQVTMRSVPSLNMLQGASCLNPVRIVTLKFKVKEGLAPGSVVGSAFNFAAVAVTPTASAGPDITTAPCQPLPFTVTVFAPLADGDIVKNFVVDAPHASEYTTENAFTVHSFDPNSVETMGVTDPFFAGGGTLFAPTDKKEINIYVTAVDFADVKGGDFLPYNLQRNVWNDSSSSTSVLDLSKVETHFYGLFFGRDALNACPKIPNYGGNYKAIAQRLEQMSMGRWKVNVISFNELLAEAMGLDTETDVWPWITLDGAMMEYAVQGPADCEDYRQFSRVHQAGIDAAYEQIEAAWAARGINKKMDFENIDFIFTVVPYNTHGYRSGLQGGSGLDTSFSYNDQSMLQRDSEYRHQPGVKTRGGRVVGSGVFGVKGIWTYSPTGIVGAVTTAMHEFTHGMGMFDDYSYGSLGTNTGEATASGAGSYGVMGSSMNSSSPDLPVWRKYRMGWIDDDELQVILPGDTVTLNLRALGSYMGDGGAYTDDPSIKTRMVVIPKEWRTRDTFGVNDTTAYGYPWLGNVWNCGWNPNKLNYNWYDWFTNPWVGGETNAIKSFPTFYTLETRKALGLDSTIGSGATGVVVSYIANPTFETGHGAGGFKIVNASNTGLKAGGTFTDPHIGLTVRVNTSNVFYDNVTITYTGAPTSAAQHTYMGILKASNNFVTAGEAFNVDFDIMTLGCPAPNDTANSVSATVTRRATPLGVPGGVAGFTMEVTFDATQLEYVSTGKAPFNCTVNTANAAKGTLVITAKGTKMIDKDVILSLRFKAKAGASLATSTVSGRITGVRLLNWRGEVLGAGAVPGFNGVGSIGAGTFAAFHANASNNITNSYIQSFGGTVTVGAVPTYTVSGHIICDTPGPAPGSFIGIESTVQVRSGSTVIGTAKSNWDGDFTIKGIPAGSGYTLYVTKSKYSTETSGAFAVAGNTIAPTVQLARLTYTVSGTIYGSYNSDGSGATPLAGVDVYLINTGNAYSVIGGPVKTDASGQYTVAGIEVGRAFAAVAVSVKGTEYEGLYMPQMHLAPTLHLPQMGVTKPLEVNLGMKFGENGSDYNYPSGSGTLGAANLYCFANNVNRTGRNVTLTQTQDVRLRMTTKSTAISFQLRDMAGNAIGAPVNSLGNANGDDIIRNVPPGGPYYIEASRSGYISGCTVPFGVFSTRVILRNGVATNTMDLQATGSGQTLAGTVVNSITGEPLEGVRIASSPYSATYGAGVPIFTAANGTFSYLTVNSARDLIFSKEGFITQTVYRAAGAATGLTIQLVPVNAEAYAAIVVLEEEIVEEEVVVEEEIVEEEIAEEEVAIEEEVVVVEVVAGDIVE